MGDEVVVSPLPEFRQIYVRTLDGEFYPVVEDTPGVPMASLRLGQRLLCHVTER